MTQRLADCASRAWAAYARSVRGRRIAWFAAWLVATAATAAAATIGAASGTSGAASGAWPDALRHLAWLLQLVSISELMLALCDGEPGSRKALRAMRLAPAAGLGAALVAAAFVAAVAAAGAPVPPGWLAPSAFFVALGYPLAYLVELAIVLPAAWVLPPGAVAATRSARATILAGWAMHAAGLAHDAWAGLYPRAAHEAPLAPYGALAFALGAAVSWALTLHRDAQRRERTQRHLLDSARKYRHVYYSAPVALMSVDPLGTILRWNDLASLYFGHELRQGRVNTLASVIGRERAAALLEETAAAGRHRCEIALGADDSAAGARTCALDALLAGGAIEISLVDVTERTLLARTLEHMAYHDVLTDLLNRRGLERELETVARSLAGGARASLIHADLSRFKAINDLFGHAAGDSVVSGVAKRLQRSLPASARLGRLAGNEFLVVLPDCDPAQARECARSLVACIADEPYDVDGKRIRVEATVGVVDAAPGMDAAELIAYASAACDTGKRGESGIVEVESSQAHLARYRAEVQLGARLRESLPVDRMCVYAQPIVPLAARGERPTMCYEVLLRERDERGAIQSPARLIAAAERYGAMRAIDRFMLERTLQHLSSNPRHAASLDFMTVNLSGVSLNDDRFLADAHALLAEHAQAARKVCLEITESVAMYDLGSTRAFVERMGALGVRIALDDFGAGHSSFAYLRELPASLVKIDGQFMLGIDRLPRNQVIVSGMRRLTEELGMACLAEWVEDVAALEFLLRVDMDYAQGYVLARPQPIESWLTGSLDLRPLDEARRRIAVSGEEAADRAQVRRRPVPVEHVRPAAAVPT